MGKSTHKKTYSKIYRTWTAMKSRCRNPKDNNYINYGKRGINYCERWEKFENFYEDMGDLSFYDAQLDRIDNEKGYYKENCRWISHKENSRNRRSTVIHDTHVGKIVQIELSDKIGWSKDQFRWFLKRYGIGWILQGFKEGTLPLRKNIEINRSDLIGKKFGKWEVLKFSYYTKREGHLYLCKCECGIEKEIQRSNLLKGKSTRCRSCGLIDSWKERRNKS